MGDKGLLKRLKQLSRPDDSREPVYLLEEEIADHSPIDPDLLSSVNWIEINNMSLIPQVLFDQDLKVRWRNEAYRKFRESDHFVFNYSEDPFDSLFTSFSGDSDAANTRRTGLLSALDNPDTRYSWQGTVEGVGVDFRKFKQRLSITPEILDDDGNPVLFRATFDNITLVIDHLVQSGFESILRASLSNDDDTGNHIKRVNTYSRILAESLLKAKENKPGKWPELDVVFVEDIGQLAAFHDVGKIGTPDWILQKTGKLTEEEWLIMKQHPMTGAMIMASHPNMMVRDIVRSHHERWDGSGYPSSIDPRYPAALKGDQIPLCGRIVAVADVYDALRTKRFYKEAFSEKKAYEIIIEGQGNHFDPDIIEIFKELRKDFNRIWKELAD